MIPKSLYRGRRPKLEASEQDLQRAAVDYLTHLNPRCIWFHVPNGGKRSAREAAIFRGLGVKAGIPDLVFLWKGGCAGLELKTPNGRQSTVQKKTEQDFISLGIPYEVLTDLNDLPHILHRWGLLSEPATTPRRGQSPEGYHAALEKAANPGERKQ